MKHLLQFQMENVSENHFHPLKIFSISLTVVMPSPSGVVLGFWYGEPEEK